jgi:hypothetical protein
MGRIHPLASLVLGLFLAAGAARAETYNYTVQHPTFGDIGSYTDRIERRPDGMRIDTTLNIVVRTLGVVVHREEARRSQLWRNGRLVHFEGVTTTNGKTVEVKGEAQGDRFVVESPAGPVTAPADVVVSDPWQATRSGAGTGQATMLATKTGRIGPVQSSGGDPVRLNVHGIEVPVRHFSYASDKTQDVWVSERGIPLQFRTIENGTPIDFTLTQESLAALRH